MFKYYYENSLDFRGPLYKSVGASPTLRTRTTIKVNVITDCELHSEENKKVGNLTEYGPGQASLRWHLSRENWRTSKWAWVKPIFASYGF